MYLKVTEASPQMLKSRQRRQGQGEKRCGMGARGGHGVPACLAARGLGVWECTSYINGMAVKVAKLAPAIINYAAPLSWGRASAWYVLLEAPEEAALLPLAPKGRGALLPF